MNTRTVIENSEGAFWTGTAWNFDIRKAEHFELRGKAEQSVATLRSEGYRCSTHAAPSYAEYGFMDGREGRERLTYVFADLGAAQQYEAGYRNARMKLRNEMDRR